MVKELNHGRIRLVVNRTLGHCSYSELNDIAIPLATFFKDNFKDDNLIDLNLVMCRSGLLDLSMEANSLLKL